MTVRTSVRESYETQGLWNSVKTKELKSKCLDGLSPRVASEDFVVN
jgi:hypothetical protein